MYGKEDVCGIFSVGRVRLLKGAGIARLLLPLPRSEKQRRCLNWREGDVEDKNEDKR